VRTPEQIEAEALRLCKAFYEGVKMPGDCMERYIKAESERDNWRRVAEDSLERQDSQPKWRDIAEAPKDGTPLLLWVPSYFQGKGGCEIGINYNRFWQSIKSWNIEPTHFMELPKGPEV